MRGASRECVVCKKNITSEPSGVCDPCFISQKEQLAIVIRRAIHVQQQLALMRLALEELHYVPLHGLNLKASIEDAERTCRRTANNVRSSMQLREQRGMIG